jgi:hypothetical protein
MPDGLFGNPSNDLARATRWISQGIFLPYSRGSGAETLGGVSQASAQVAKQASERKADNHLVVSHALPALYRAQVTHNAIMSVAHSS